MKRLLRLCGYCCLLIGNIFFVQKILAATFSFNVTSVEPTLINTKESEVKVSIDISNMPGESYFRAAFQKEGGGSYIGYMKNDRNEWVKIKTLGTTECTDYFKISDTNASSAAFVIKIGEDETVDSGKYYVKSHRYTNTCKSYSEASKAVLVDLVFPTPMPTNTPTPTPAPTNTPTPSHSPTPTPTPRPTVTPTRSPTPTLTPIVTEEATESVSVNVLGSQIREDTPASSSGSPLKPYIISTAFIGLGLAILSGLFVWQKHNEIKNEDQP